jgi:DNA repair protein RadC
MTAGWTLAILDDEWRPRLLLPVTSDWRGVMQRLLLSDGDWLTLMQRRPPAASPAPRTDDFLLTRVLCRQLRPLDMRLADHIIAAGARRFSFRAAGLL